MNGKTRKILKICPAFALAFVFLFAAIYTYWGDFAYVYELTFLSNFLTGTFLAVAGILWLCNKSVPQILFLNFTMLLLIVFGVCMVFNAEFNFEGGFVFLHAINPILMFLFYLFFSDQTKSKRPLIFSVLVMPIAYLIFALIFGTITGNYIYFFLDYKEYGAGYSVLFLLGISLGLIALSIGLYYLNKAVHKYILKDI